MKHLILALVALFVSPAVLADIAGFDSLRWGMTLQETQHVYPNFEEWDYSDIDPFTVKRVVRHTYGLRSHIVAGCVFALELGFIDNKLYQVVLDQHLDNDMDCQVDIKRMLLEKYGHYIVSGSQGEDILSWSSALMSIVLRIEQLSSGKQHLVVVYTNDKAVKELLNKALFKKGENL